MQTKRWERQHERSEPDHLPMYSTYAPDIVVGGDVEFSEAPCSPPQCITLQVTFDGQGNVLRQDGVEQALLCGSWRKECNCEAQDAHKYNRQ